MVSSRCGKGVEAGGGRVWYEEVQDARGDALEDIAIPAVAYESVSHTPVSLKTISCDLQ